MKIAYPVPRRSVLSRVRAGIYVPTHMDTPERWPRPKWISRFMRPPRGRLFTIPFIWSGNPCEPLVDTIIPSGAISEVTDGTWFHSNSDIWNSVGDEGDDGEGAFTFGGGETECPSQDSSNFVVALDNPSGPVGGSDCQGMRYDNRWADDTDDGEIQGCADHNGSLLQGASNRKSATEQTDIGGLTAVTDVLSAAQIDNITDHNDLRSRNSKSIGKEAPKVSPPTCVTTYTGVDYYAL
jgi:hypothetical protein